MSTNLNPKYYFENQEDAVNQVIETLPLDLLSDNETVVIGVSSKAVYFAKEIASKLKSQMDILLTSSILAPNNSDLPIAMISETHEVIMHKALIDAFEISEDYIYAQAEQKYTEDILDYVHKYRKGNELISLEGKYVVLTDECIETGLTMMVALKSVITRGAKNIYIATPILDKAVYQNLLTVCDGVFCPHTIQDYISIEYYYNKYQNFSFEEIEEMIEIQMNKETQMKEKD